MEKGCPSEEEKHDRQIDYSNRCHCGRSVPNGVRFFYLSLVVNLVFLVLFVVVFIRLDGVQTNIARLQSSVEMNTEPIAGTQGSMDSTNDSAVPTRNPNSTTSPTSTKIIVHNTLLKSMPYSRSRRETTDDEKPTQPASNHPSSVRPVKSKTKNIIDRCVKRVTKRMKCPCEEGPPGEKGERGRKGREGADGRAGNPGTPGARGHMGPQGPAGSSGQKGDPGKGDKGDRGLPGLPGKAGPQGYKGTKGERGEKGQEGPQGPKGETGSLESVIRPSAHLTGFARSTLNSPQTGIMRDYEGSLGGAHTLGGMSYSNGTLTVPSNGRYYVYSQLYFQAQINKPLIHFVHLNAGGSETVIMRSIATKCRLDGTHFYSSYQGGVFELRTGNQILVGVSNHHSKHINMAESASFFGAFLI